MAEFGVEVKSPQSFNQPLLNEPALAEDLKEIKLEVNKPEAGTISMTDSPLHQKKLLKFDSQLTEETQNRRSTYVLTQPTHQKTKELLKQIKTVDPNDSRLRRLGLFFSEQKLEQAKEIAENFRLKRQQYQQKGSPGKSRDDDVRSSSRSSEETLLENLSENSRYSNLDSFQTVIREKVIDIKVSVDYQSHNIMQQILDSAIESINDNAKVLHEVQFNNMYKMVSKQKLASVIGEISGSNLLASAHTGYAKSDEQSLQAQTQAFMTMMQKLKLKQDELEKQLNAQTSKIDSIGDVYEQRLNQKVTNMNYNLKQFKTEVTERLEKKEGNYTQIIQQLSTRSEEIFENLQAETQKLENSIKFRVSDCETLVRSRITEDYVKNLGERIKIGIIDSFDRKNEATIDRLYQITEDNARKGEQLKESTEKTLLQYRKEIHRFEKDFKSLSTKKEVGAVKEVIDEARGELESRYENAKKENLDLVMRIDNFQRAVLQMKIEMKSRDDALKRVPPNCAKILKEMKQEMKETNQRCDEVEGQFTSLVSVSKYEAGMKKKIDVETFKKVFPNVNSPAEHLRDMIKAETMSFTHEIRNLVKLWDSKITNLRSELNLHGLYRRISKLAKTEQMIEEFKVRDEKSGELQEQIEKLRTKLSGIGLSNQEIEEKISLIYDRQKEVNIGKRNINCLSCSVEPGQRDIKGRDGNVYKGTNSRSPSTEIRIEARTRSGSNEKQQSKGLLNLNWDNIGLKRQQYSTSAFNRHRSLTRYMEKNQSHNQDWQALSQTAWRINTDSSPKLHELLTEEIGSKAESSVQKSRTQITVQKNSATAEEGKVVSPGGTDPMDDQLSPPDEVRVSVQDASIGQLPYIYETSDHLSNIQKKSIQVQRTFKRQKSGKQRRNISQGQAQTQKPYQNQRTFLLNSKNMEGRASKEGSVESKKVMLQTGQATVSNETIRQDSAKSTVNPYEPFTIKKVTEFAANSGSKSSTQRHDKQSV